MSRHALWLGGPQLSDAHTCSSSRDSLTPSTALPNWSQNNIVDLTAARLNAEEAQLVVLIAYFEIGVNHYQSQKVVCRFLYRIGPKRGPGSPNPPANYKFALGGVVYSPLRHGRRGFV